MSAQELEAVKAKIKALPPSHTQAIGDLRKLADKAIRAFPVGQDTRIETVTIGQREAERLTPAGADNTACLLYLHGGGYAIGSPRSHRHLAADLAARTGIMALVPDYRLAPEHPFPAAVDDALAAYRSLIDAGIAPGRIVIAGDSAGGGLTVSCLLAARAAALPMPAAAACLSPWADMTASGTSYRDKAEADVLVTQRDLTRYGSAYLGPTPATAPLASPALADLQGLPPLLIQVGGEEMLLDDARLLAAKAKASGVAAQLEEWPGMLHVWHWYWPVLEEGRQANAAISNFFKTHLGRGRVKDV
jgi:epsilon-lactone hydrolase